MFKVCPVSAATQACSLLRLSPTVLPDCQSLADKDHPTLPRCAGAALCHLSGSCKRDPVKSSTWHTQQALDQDVGRNEVRRLLLQQIDRLSCSMCRVGKSNLPYCLQRIYKL